MPNESAKIIVAAKHGSLTKVRDVPAIEGTINALKINFQFKTSDWDEATKTAVFIRGRATPSTINQNPVCKILDENNECDVPPEILAKDGMFSVGVFGIRDDYRIVSHWICYRIDNGCYADGSTPVDPNSTIYEQIISMLNNKSEVNHNHDELYYRKDEADDKYLIQSDWSQNDIVAVDYIKNRPFYEKYEDNLIIEGTITYDAAEMVATINNYENYVLNLNTKYIVTVNDISVECQFYSYPDGSQEDYFGDKEGKVYAVGYPPGTVGMHLNDIVFDNEYFNYHNINFNDDRQKYCIGASISIVKRDCTIKQIDSKYLPGVQITPINQDGNMTAEDFMSLSDGLYFFYNGPFDYTYGLVGILDGCWACYNCGYYYVDIKNDNGVLVADWEGSLDGFGYAESDYLLSRIFPTDIQEGQTIVASYNEDGDIIFNASDFPKGITHVNTDGSMTPEEFRNLEDGVYIFDKELELIGYQNTSTQVYGCVFYYKDSSGNFSADCISTLTHISPYYGTFYITSLIPSDAVDDTKLDTMLEEVLV